MYNSELKNKVHIMFKELTEKAREISDSYSNTQKATERISSMVASKISAESEGYVIDMYTGLVEKIREEPFFKNPKNLNAFYRLNIRKQLNEKYHFDINSLEAYKKGIKFDEVNSLYVTAGAAAGTLAVGGILKYIVSSSIDIPIVVLIAGAVLVGLAVYFYVPARNKKQYIFAVCKFLHDMENEILDWLADIESYMEIQVQTLYK